MLGLLAASLLDDPARALAAAQALAARLNTLAEAGARGWVGSAEGEAHYSAAKAGVMGLTRAAAAEAAPYGVRVNAVAPGLIYNEFLGRIYPPEFFVEAEKRAALKRSGKPAEVAELILFLASDRSSYITGETICISGGSYFHP